MNQKARKTPHLNISLIAGFDQPVSKLVDERAPEAVTIIVPPHDEYGTTQILSTLGNVYLESDDIAGVYLRHYSPRILRARLQTISEAVCNLLGHNPGDLAKDGPDTPLREEIQLHSAITDFISVMEMTAEMAGGVRGETAGSVLPALMALAASTDHARPVTSFTAVHPFGPQPGPDRAFQAILLVYVALKELVNADTPVNTVLSLLRTTPWPQLVTQGPTIS